MRRTDRENTAGDASSPVAGRVVGLLCAAALALCFALASCAQPSAATRPAATGATALDECADRLHDVSGMLLLFYQSHHRLPQSLEEFKAAQSGLPPLTCPGSGAPFIWRPEGPPVPGQKYDVLLAEPVHNGKRWAIVAQVVEPGSPLTLRVSLLPVKPAK